MRRHMNGICFAKARLFQYALNRYASWVCHTIVIRDEVPFFLRVMKTLIVRSALKGGRYTRLRSEPADILLSLLPSQRLDPVGNSSQTNIHLPIGDGAHRMLATSHRSLAARNHCSYDIQQQETRYI